MKPAVVWSEPGAVPRAAMPTHSNSGLTSTWGRPSPGCACSPSAPNRTAQAKILQILCGAAIRNCGVRVLKPKA